MNFDFSDDQKFLQNEARKFLDANCGAGRVRKVLDDEATLFDAELWAQVAGQGWLGAAIPEEHGGLGLGHLELCVIAEELGRAVAPIPFASTVYFLAEAVMLAGTEAQKAAILPKIAAGEVIGCVASVEGPGALTAGNVQASVSGGKLNGTKIPVTDGGIASHALVLAKDGGQLSLFLVGMALLLQIAKRKEIALRFGHRHVVDLQKLAVQPIFCKQLPGRAFALGDLVFMVRKLQVHSARVQVESLAEIFHRHRRAFDMPPRPPAAEWSIPTWFLVLADQFPKGEITCVLFVVFIGIDALAAAGDIARKIDLRQLAILWKRSDAVIDRPFGFICVPVF